RAGAEGVVTWVAGMTGTAFTDHPLVATVPAERATWDAERTRLAGFSDPQAWAIAAKAWQGQGCPHRAGYAWWRRAQAQLAAGRPAPAARTAPPAAPAPARGPPPPPAQ